MIKREACPQCGSRQHKRNGRIHTGKQNHKCKAWGRAFVLVPENHIITEAQRAVIERLLLERISLRGICRVIGVGLRFSQQRLSARGARRSYLSCRFGRSGRIRLFPPALSQKKWRTKNV